MTINMLLKLAKKIYYKFFEYYIIIIIYYFPRKYLEFKHKQAFGAKPNLNNPKTYAEKMIWLMFFWKHPLKTICADKYKMRKYVEENGCADVLVPLLGIYSDPEEIDFDSLPEKFALKCSHGCGYNILCNDKANFNYTDAKSKLSNWVRIDYSKVHGEPHYHGMKPKIILEPFLEMKELELPVDYKFYCINGEVYCYSVILDRKMFSSSEIKEVFYDKNGNRIEGLLRDSNEEFSFVEKPIGLERMLDVCRILSKPFPFVRIDFYSIEGKPLLGEFTFTSSGGLGAAFSDFAQIELGNKIVLPPKVSTKRHVKQAKKESNYYFI
jgi:hypothetical protein